MAEESAVSIRVIKAFGREGERTDRFGATARHAFDRSMDAAHLRALYQPLMGFLPILGLGVVLVYGGILTIDGSLTLGEFVAFYLYLTLLMVAVPVARDAGGPGPARGGRRHPHLRGARQRARDPRRRPPPSPCRRAAATCAWRASRSPTRPTRRSCCRTSTWTSRPGAPSP